MIDNKVSTKLNEQINHEMHAAYLYLSMSAYFESINLPGFAKWMQLQFNEETGHAMKIFDHLHERGAKVTLTQIEAPQVEWKSPLDVFKAALAHEQKITGLINKLMDLAIAAKDHASASFLQWYVDEQVEEEDNVTKIIEQLKMVKDHSPAILMLDQVLGRRE